MELQLAFANHVEYIKALKDDVLKELSMDDDLSIIINEKAEKCYDHMTGDFNSPNLDNYRIALCYILSFTPKYQDEVENASKGDVAKWLKKVLKSSEILEAIKKVEEAYIAEVLTPPSDI